MKNGSDENLNDVEMTIWLKDFPATVTEFKALYALKQGIHGLILIEEKFIPDEIDDYAFSQGQANTLNQSPSIFQ